MSKIKKQIETYATRLYGTRTVSQHLYNDGKNKDNMKFEKNTLLFDAIRDKFEMIKTTEHYPKDDLQQFDLELDVTVVPTVWLNKLLEE
jgi:hypothetical protein